MMRFIDSNVFVYHLAGDLKYGDRSTEILESVEKGEKAATSTIVLIQVCSYLKWKRREKVIPIFLSLLKGLASLQKMETTFIDFEEARDLQFKLKLPWRMWDDLVIAVQMKRNGIDEIYSNDSDFDKIPFVKRVF